MLGGVDKMMIVRCKVCFKIKGENKLLVPKFDSFIKHSSLKKCIVIKPTMVVGAYFVNPNNAHVKNEKLYVSIRHDTSTSKARKAKKKKKYVQFVAIRHLLIQGCPMIDFENFLLFEKIYLTKDMIQEKVIFLTSPSFKNNALVSFPSFPPIPMLLCMSCKQWKIKSHSLL
jgi:hypothetical protein